MTPQRRKYDGQDIVILPDGSMWDRNADRMWLAQMNPAPRTYVPRLSLDDPFCKAVEEEKRGARAE